MKTFRIISGTDARENGYYATSPFILEREEQYYDNGLWLLPDAGYAEWYCTFQSLVDKARDIFHD